MEREFRATQPGLIDAITAAGGFLQGVGGVAQGVGSLAGALAQPAARELMQASLAGGSAALQPQNRKSKHNKPELIPVSNINVNIIAELVGLMPGMVDPQWIVDEAVKNMERDHMQGIFEKTGIPIHLQAA